MKDSPETVHQGGCLCGAVRYRVTGAPRWVAHCHCKSCRKASGSAVVTWAGYTRETFEVAAGRPVRFTSSPGVVRSFCPRCGSPLTYEAERFAGEVHVTVGSLDEPAGFAPTAHVWTSERVAWLHIADDLPRHPEFGASGDGG